MIVCVSLILSSKYVLRLLSSSDKTSSSSRIGDSFITSLINWICASFKESAAVRCCPWEPYLRISIPFTIKLISSLCGPTVVVEYFKSFCLFFASSVNYHTLHRGHIPVKFFLSRQLIYCESFDKLYPNV